MTSIINKIVNLFAKNANLSFINQKDISLPHAIWFAGKPANKADFIEAKLTPIQQVEAAVGFKWSEIISGEIAKEQISLLKKFSKKNHNVTQEMYLTALLQICENCIIRWIDGLGWSVTLRPGKKINAGFLCCYTGELKSNPIHQNSNYSSREYFFSLLKDDDFEVIVDAKNKGNFSRFFPFLLESEQLENFIIEPNLSEKICLANLKFEIALIHGIPVPSIFAPHPIIAPDDKEVLLGLNYSSTYLHKVLQLNKEFNLVEKFNFRIIDASLYPQKLIQVELENISYTFQVSRLRIMIAKTIPNLSHKLIGFDEATQRYLEINVSDLDIYHAVIASPKAQTIKVKATITNPIAGK